MTDTPEPAPETEGVETIPEDQGDDAAPVTEEEAEQSSEWAKMVEEETGEKPEGQDAETESEVESGGTAESEVDWSAALPEHREAFEKMQARADAAEHGRKSAEGRQAATQRKLNDMVAAQGEREGQNDAAAMAELGEEINGIVDEYPDIAKPLVKMIGVLQGQIRSLQSGQETIGVERLEAASMAQENIVREAHADYDDIADGDDFVAWAETQPEMIRRGIEANAEMIVDAASVNVILDKYKADRGIGPNGGRDPRREIQLRSNRGAPSPSPGATVREDNGDSREQTYEGEWQRMLREEERKASAGARR